MPSAKRPQAGRTERLTGEVTRPVYSAFYYWWRLKRRIWRAVVRAIRAAVIVSLLLVLAWLVLWLSWPEAGDEVRRFVVRTGNAFLQVTGRSLRFLGEALEGGGPVPSRPILDRSGETETGVRAVTPKGEGQIRIFKGNQVEVLKGQTEVLSGRARTVDGDTLELKGVRIRLHGIDAPESVQTCIAGGKRWRCGQRAASALAERVSGRSVSCKMIDRDRYGRMLAVCLVGGKDLNAWLTSEGWALAYRRYSTDYVDAEASARSARRGVWRGRFVAPWDWRAGVRLDSRQADATPNAGRAVREGGRRCRIKGNIGREGARIYHVPGGRYYESTGISPSRGERWFCTEGEARAAGWRRSRR